MNFDFRCTTQEENGRFVRASGKQKKKHRKWRNLSYGVVNGEMLMVFVAILVEMLLTLILNMSTVYKFTTENWFIRKFIIVAVDFSHFILYYDYGVYVWKGGCTDSRLSRSSLLKFKWMCACSMVCDCVAPNDVWVNQGVLVSSTIHWRGWHVCSHIVSVIASLDINTWSPSSQHSLQPIALWQIKQVFLSFSQTNHSLWWHLYVNFNIVWEFLLFDHFQQ